MKLNFRFPKRKSTLKPKKAKLTPKERNEARKLLAKKIGVYSFYAFIVLLLMVSATFAFFAKDLPTPSNIANRRPSQSTKIYDRTGTILLYETGEQKRTVVTSDQLPQYLKDATTSIEDTNFYKHHGFDPRAVASAVLEKVTGRRSVTRGGSTITQQYVKNALLNSNRSLARKIKELILAIELEFMYDKDEILTMYLNEIPYGNNTAGAEAAARMYYSKAAKDLTLAEAATLAAIPQAPTYYSPYGAHLKELNRRRNYILDRMATFGKITPAEAEEAKKQDTTSPNIAVKPRRDSILAPHFAMYVLEQVANQYGEEKVQKEGLNITTTLDYDKQKMAEETVNAGAEKYSRYGASNAALVAVNPANGQVLAMVGSRDYFDQSIDGNVNVADSERQPGSSFKPFTYATLFKKPEYSPSKIIFDLETDFGGGYVPHNYNNRFNGPVTIRQALSNSLNIPAVKGMALAGIDNVIRTAEDMGITTLTDRERYGLSLALGAAEVKPVEMAGAFSVFATGGIRNDLKSVIKVVDLNGKTIYEYNAEKEPGRRVLDAQIAYEISHILSDNDSRALVFGTRSSLYFPNRTVAAKTGTTSDFKDAWTVGYTPSLATAVWVGNSNGAKMKTGADGSVIAGPIFHSFMEKALAGIPNQEFTRPDGITEIEVDKFSNKLPSDPSGERIKDIFATWQAPTDKDNVNVTLRMCRGTNKIAPDDMPETLTEVRTFRTLHSEMPNNPNWENPVRSWAQANGYSDTVPTEKCNMQDFKPSVVIESPQDGATVTGIIQIVAGVNGPSSITSVEFFIDDISIGSVSSVPYSISYNSTNLATNITHRIAAVAVDTNGVSTKAEVTIGVTKDSTPVTISGVNATSTSTAATVSWTTSGTATSQVQYDTVSHASSGAYASASAQNATTSTSHTTTLSGLLPNTTYYYRVISLASNGTSATSPEHSFKTQP